MSRHPLGNFGRNYSLLVKSHSGVCTPLCRNRRLDIVAVYERSYRRRGGGDLRDAGLVGGIIKVTCASFVGATLRNQRRCVVSGSLAMSCRDQDEISVDGIVAAVAATVLPAAISHGIV